MERLFRPGASLALALLMIAVWGRPAQAASTSLVSRAAGGGPADLASGDASASGSGRYIAFESDASNLVADDANALSDVFVRDRSEGTTAVVSVRSNGNQGNGPSDDPAISRSGRYVAFESDASNLVSGDSNGETDVFLHDRSTTKTIRVSVRTNGNEANGPSDDPAISPDGRYVAFESDATNLTADDVNHATDVFVHDLETDHTVRVSVASGGGQGSGDSGDPSLSGTGLVAFHSYAPDLVTNDSNGAADVFVHDLARNRTWRVSVRQGGGQAAGGGSYEPGLSADGRAVAFESDATNLVKGDTNGASDVFVHDLARGTIRRVSVRSNGKQARGGDSYDPSMGLSGDGRRVAFESSATNLVRGDTNGEYDIFLYDLPTGAIRRVSIAGRNESNGPSYDPAISLSGRWVAFESRGSTLFAGDTNGVSDVFVRGPW